MKKRLKEYWDAYALHVFGVALAVFLMGSLAVTVASVFFTDRISAQMRVEMNLFLILAGVTFIYQYLQTVGGGGGRSNRERVVLFDSTTPDHSEIEALLSRSRNSVTIRILGNSMTTMWNTLLKHYLERVVLGTVGTNVTVEIVQRVDSACITTPASDPTIASMIQWYSGLTKGADSVTIRVSAIDFPTYFTGICIDNDYVRTRMINTESTREIIRIASKNASEVEDASIDWYLHETPRV